MPRLSHVKELGVVTTFVLLAVSAQAQITARMSIDVAGQEGNAKSQSCAISGDGRYVVFESTASNLVPNDTNGVSDVFVHDRQTGETWRVSVDSQQKQADGPSYRPVVAQKSSTVAFESEATNLAPGLTHGTRQIYVHSIGKTGPTTIVSVDSVGTPANGDCFRPALSENGLQIAFDTEADGISTNPDFNGAFDVFMHDRITGATVRVSEKSAGEEGNGDSLRASITADGRFVAFSSDASNLVVGDHNSQPDVFLRDCQSHAMTLVSVDSSETQGNGLSDFAQIGSDGTVCAFQSSATNLVTGDSNGVIDLFLRDLQANTTERLSLGPQSEQADAGCIHPALSANGRFCAFYSYATNLVPADTNGTADIFVKDRLTGASSRLSVADNGDEANGGSFDPCVSRDGSCVAFEGVASNLVPLDTNGVRDVFVHAPMSLHFVGTPKNPNVVNYTVANANAKQVGMLALVLLSCTGVTVTHLPNGLPFYLSFDACTVSGLVASAALSGYVDPSGAASTPPVTFPPLPPGVTIFSAALTYDLARETIGWTTLPISWTSE